MRAARAQVRVGDGPWIDVGPVEITDTSPGDSLLLGFSRGRYHAEASIEVPWRHRRQSIGQATKIGPEGGKIR